MRRVIIESPYASDNPETFEANLKYAQEAMKDCILRGEAPIAFHLLYTQVLADDVPEERSLGMTTAGEWYHVVDAVVVYTDRGLSQGMEAGIRKAKALWRTIEYRSLR